MHSWERSSHPRAKGLAVALLLLLGGLLAVQPAEPANAAGSLSATATPTELALTPGGTATGVVVLENAGATSATIARVQPVAADPSLKVSMLDSVAAVPAGASVALSYQVTRTTESTGQDVPVRFVVSYRQRATPRSDPVSQVIVASVTVKAAASLAVVQAKIDSNVQTINENRPGQADLLITNPRETSIRVDAVQVSAPTSVKVTLACPNGGQLTVLGSTTRSTDCSFPVAARSQEVLPLRLETEKLVTPGPRSVVVRVEASVPESRVSASVVATVAFTVDVFAESDILKAVGVPVFLLLPGVVVVLTGWFLIGAASPWRQLVGSPQSASVISTATITAVLGLAISLVIAAVYPALTSSLVPGYERNYLRAYGFRDFYYVFGYSFAIAIAAWLLSLLAFWGFRWLFLPVAGDKAASLLRKLGLRGLVGGGATFWVRVNAQTQPRKGLEFGDRPDGRVLLLPVIMVKVDQNKDSSLKGTIETQAGANRAFELWRTIRRARRAQTVTTINYAPDYVNEPQVQPEQQWPRSGQETPFVQVS
jgi:hypothetical protein